MIFAAGATVALLVYSVAEPLEQQTGHFFANAGYRSQDEKVRRYGLRRLYYATLMALTLARALLSPSLAVVSGYVCD
jgi:choline-glycine betaine transporter